VAKQYPKSVKTNMDFELFEITRLSCERERESAQSLIRRLLIEHWGGPDFTDAPPEIVQQVRAQIEADRKPG